MTDLSGWVKEHFVDDLGVEKITPIHGGETNIGFRLDSSVGKYFLKVNPKEDFHDMLEKEALSLKLLNQTEIITVPKVLAVGKKEKVNFMLMDWVEKAEPNRLFWENFGFDMASFHQNKSFPFYGFVTDNYIGSLKQPNMGCNSWSDFFIQQRLVPLVGDAYDKNIIDQLTVQKFEALYSRLPDIFSDEPPSLLHGDFWYGNYMCNKEGKAVLIDPSCYFGNRIMDIAMSKLFGGFPDQFYHAYNSVWHLPYGWQDAVEIANLYPLLVHANMFKGQYGEMIKNILYRF